MFTWNCFFKLETGNLKFEKANTKLSFLTLRNLCELVFSLKNRLILFFCVAFVLVNMKQLKLKFENFSYSVVELNL